MFLEKYGKESSSKRTRHINIKYFFITDCGKRKMMSVKYCPTDEMDTDFLSKPLQGNKIFKFRNRIMNIKEQPRQ